jgi:hypothetical protein
MSSVRRPQDHLCLTQIPALPSAIGPFANSYTGHQDAQKEECQEGYPILPNGVRRLRYRPDDLRQYPVRQAGARAQGHGRPNNRARRGRRQNPTHHSWCVILYPLHLSTMVNLCPELDEEGTRISLTIVDTPGFGDQIDNEAR